MNGGNKVDIPDYNFVYNMLHDYTQGADALKRRCVGGENADPSNKQYIVGNDIIERRGYSKAKYDAADDANNDVLRDRQEYCVRSWLSLLGGNASTKIIDKHKNTEEYKQKNRELAKKQYEKDNHKVITRVRLYQNEIKKLNN